MTTRRIDPRAGWVNPGALPRGPNGRALCRECGTEVPAGCQTFCGPVCVDRWKIRTQPGYVRQRLWDRDHGVCAMCGVDTVALAEDMKPKGWTGRRPRGWLEVRAFTDATHVEDCERFRAALGAQYCARELNRYWDADHVVPVVEGGGGCGLENYRTLCIPCHRIETAELRRRLAERKRGST